MIRSAVRRLGSTSAAPVVVLTLLGAAVAAPAAAQRVDGADSSRPYRGLFGGATTASQSGPNSLVFSGSLFGGYDDDIFARGQGPRSGNARIGGEMLGTQLSLNYAHQTPRSTFTIGSGTAARYLPARDEFVPTFYSASVGYHRQLAARTSLALRHGIGYRPFFSIVPFAGGSTLGSSLGDPGEAPAFDEVGGEAPDDFTLATDRQALRQTGSVQLSHRLTPRSGLSAQAGYGFADFRDPALDDVSNTRWRGQANYTYDFTRFMSLRLGYGYQSFARRDGQSAGNHNINVGILYNQPFVLQRGQTRFSFSTGTSLLARERLESERDGGKRLVLRATGTATLLHVFNPNWQTQATYTRSVGFIDGLGQAVQGDVVLASLGGLLTRRIDMQASVGYTSGAIGLRERNFDTALANARVRLALTDKLALFAQYFYYQYNFDPTIAEQVIVAPELERQGVRVGLTFWLPLVR